MSKSKGKILLVEDDPNLGFIVQDRLKRDGFDVALGRTGKEGLKMYNNGSFDLCLLDVMLPEKDGFSLAEDIRKVNEDTPIIFLTARDMIEDKAKGYSSGGDDYLTKPFSHEELVLRINALLKRANKNQAPREKGFQLADLYFDPIAHTLTGPNSAQRLTKKEAHVLKLLCEHREKVLERDLILNLVWGKDDYFTGRSLDVFISKLRKYLKSDSRIAISNIHGVGFKLDVDV